MPIDIQEVTAAVELQQVRYVTALAEHLHFGRAARWLGIRQPSLSQQVKTLEGELGVRLFERGTNGVSVTIAGEAFLENARRAVAYADAAIADAERAARGESGHLAVSFLGSATYTLLPRIFRDFRQLYPDVHIRPSELTSHQQIREIVGGHLDLGFVRSHLLADQRDAVSLLPVSRESLVAAFPAKHPLARKTVVPLSALRTEPLILPPRSDEPASYDLAQHACHVAGFQPIVAAEASQAHTILGLVAGGLGIAIGPSSFNRVGRAGVVCRKLSPRTYMPDLTMIWRPNDQSAAVQNFVGLVRRVRFTPKGTTVETCG